MIRHETAETPRVGVGVGVSCRELHMEDRVLVDAVLALFGVFDGVSAHGGGAEAASLSVEAVHRWTASHLETAVDAESAQDLLRDAIADADRAVAAHNAAQPGGPGRSATTAAVVLLCPATAGSAGPVAAAATIGDSRVHLLRGGQLHTLSRDHSFPEDDDRIRAKERQDRLDRARSLDDLADPIDRAAFSHRNIISAAIDGLGDVHPRRLAVELEPGDRLVLDSDGVHDNLTSDELAAVLQSADSAQAAADAVTAAAWERSRQNRADVPRAKPDDMSIVVIDIP